MPLNSDCRGVHGLRHRLSAFRQRKPCLLMVGLLICCGCGTEPPIRSYTVPVESEKVVTSDVLKGEFAPIPFEWVTPEQWTMGRNDEFSKVAWDVSFEGRTARITVSDVSLGMGLVSQLNRWRGQIGIQPDENADPMADTEVLKLGNIEATYVDFQGATETILGMMFPWEGSLWVFKFRGPKSVVASQADSFRTFCESVHVQSE
ncbi:MAG: hypothetical protein R3C49_07870 [Planctomycetaceae bacterium]